MGRSPCCEKVGLKKGTWTPEEDQKLLSYIERHGHGSWHALPTKAGLQRCGKSCRLRWTNYLRPDIKRGKFSSQEEQSIIQLHALLGNRWSAIAAHLPKRTDNEIKNYWNTHLKKKLTKMGIDPTTHKPQTNALSSVQTKDTANLNHMAQWESARLEAESRHVRESKLISTAPYYSDLGYFASAQVPLSKATVSPILPPLQPKIPPCLDILKAWQGTWTTKPNDIFTSNGSLHSPTSTLHLSDNTFTKCATPVFSENLLFPTLIDYESGIVKDSGQVNQDQLQVETRMEGSMDNTMQFNDIEYHIDAAYTEDPLRASIFMDSNNTTEPLIHNLDSSLGGGLEDNRKYWNNVFNLDTYALGSPSF